MGNDSGKGGGDRSNETHYETTRGGCATFDEVVRAGQAEARLEDDDSPGPLGDAVNNIIDGRSDVRWDATPSNLTGEKHKGDDCKHSREPTGRKEARQNNSKSDNDKENEQNKPAERHSKHSDHQHSRHSSHRRSGHSRPSSKHVSRAK